MADLLHFPADKLLGEFRVMTGRVRIGVAKNLRQHVNRHSVFHGKAGERVAGTMRRQFFVQSADRGDLGHISVHFLIAWYGQ